MVKSIYQLSWNEYNKAWLNTNWLKHRIYLPYSSRNCFQSFEYSEKRIASIHKNFLPSLAFRARLSTRNRIPPPLVFHRPFSTVECSLGYKPYLFSLLERNYESLPRSHNNKKRGGLGRVSATGMYRSIEHLKFPKFQTGIFVEWKAPRVLDPSLPRTSNRWRSRDKSFASRLRFTTCVFNVGWFSRMSFTWKLLAYNSCFIPCNDTKILWTKS